MRAPLYFVISPPPGIAPPFISPAKSPYEDVKAAFTKTISDNKRGEGRGWGRAH